MTVATSWVVASISVWLVPVYIGAMVLIFAAPRTNRAIPTREETGDASPIEDPPAPSSVDVKAPESVDPPPPSAPKPRKRKVKAKAKKAAEGETAPGAAAGPAVWVRVGPGKFVRSVAPTPDPDPDPDPAPAPADDPPPAVDEEPCQDVSMDQDDQPPFDEPRGNAPSTVDDVDSEVVPDLEPNHDEEPPSSAMEFSDRRVGRRFSASLRRRLANVRRSGEVRARQFVEAVRGRRLNVQRRFHPRSPPARA